jgi:uncharacterized membrane protein YgcG
MKTPSRHSGTVGRWFAPAMLLGWLFVAAGSVAAAGPPFPDPVSGVVVYDEADIFSDASEAEATAIIEAIEARTGAEVVVYTQTKPGVSDDEAAADGQALGNQWEVGRAGFDDGLVIIFDLDEAAAWRCAPQARQASVPPTQRRQTRPSSKRHAAYRARQPGSSAAGCPAR